MIVITQLSQMLGLIRAPGKVTVVDFYADWCGPCMNIREPYERLSQFYDSQKVQFCKCNVDTCQDCASRYHINSIPSFLIFLNGEEVGTVNGSDLTRVQMYIDRALQTLENSGNQYPNSNPNVLTSNQMSTEGELVEQMIMIGNAVKQKDLSKEADACSKVYTLLKQDSSASYFGLSLIPFFASDAFSAPAVDAFLNFMDKNGAAHVHDAESLINRILRYLLDIFLCLTWSDTTEVGYFQRVFLALISCPKARELVASSPFFLPQGIETGSELEIKTILGSILGVGSKPRGTLFSRTSAEDFWTESLMLFPPDSSQHKNIIQQIQSIMTVFARDNIAIFRTLLQSEPTRGTTFQFLKQALRLNEGYQKTQYETTPVSSRSFLAQLQAVLIELALPIFGSDFDPQTIPSYYLLEPSENINTVSFGMGGDVERITHYDEENPLPSLPADVTPYKPKVHLFFLATRVVTLCATGFIDRHTQAIIHANHSQDTRALISEKGLIEALIGSPTLAEKRLEFLNGLSRWLLSLMKASPDGTLPQDPPLEWLYLPQQLVDCVIRCTKIASFRSGNINEIISLILVLMGNTKFFPKPHTHALFPAFLIKINSTPERQFLENHPWYRIHIVRACINCYIAVDKLPYEKVQVRYELSLCIQRLLLSESLCEPVSKDFQREGTVLERFSHMAAADVNEAVDQLVQTLKQMNEMVQDSGNLLENVRALRMRQESGQQQSFTQDNQEEEANPEERRAEEYEELGSGLKNRILLFEATMDMFIQLIIRFPLGVTQNMVAQQISQMLARSLVSFAGSESKTLKIPEPEQYGFRPIETLSRLVDCLTHFRRYPNFLRCLCNCGVPLQEIVKAMKMVMDRKLITENLSWQLSEMPEALIKFAEEVDEEKKIWDDAPDFALDALLSTPLLDPIALPSDVKELENLIYVNADTIHHLFLSENKNPFTKEYLDEGMVKEFNSRPEIASACEKLKYRINAWLNEAKTRSK